MCVKGTVWLEIFFFDTFESLGTWVRENSKHQVPEFFSTRTSDIRVTNVTATLEFLDFSLIFRSFLQIYRNTRKMQLDIK